MKLWKRKNVWAWLSCRSASGHIFKGDAQTERDTLEGLTTRQLEFCLFIATLAYSKGFKDSKECSASNASETKLLKVLS